MPTHIGILQTDSVQDRFQDRFGDYPGMFERVLSAGSDEPLRFTTFDVLRGDYPQTLDSCDGYVITGSRESVYDDVPWIERFTDFVRALHTARKKTAGICFGHQLIAHALGGETRPAEAGWGVGVHETRVVNREPWMQPELESFNLLHSHKDQVVSLPEGARVTASNAFCPIAGFALDEHFITFQGHPEFEKDYARTLMDSRVEILAEKYEPGVRSLAQEVHAVDVGRWIVNFLGS